MNARPTFNYPAYSQRPADFRSAEYRPQSIAQHQPARTVDSGSLFNGTNEIGIEHHGALYRLKITRQGKLILNK
jgi:hemin uptake protein HemP